MIVGLEPINDDDINIFYEDTGNIEDDTNKAVKFSVEEYLSKELKLNKEEIEMLDINNIIETRKKIT